MRSVSVCLITALIRGLFFLFKCVFKVDPERGLILTELADGVTVEDIIVSTGCEFEVSIISDVTFSLLLL